MKTKLILPSRISPLVRLNRLLSQKQYAQSRFFIVVDENTYSHCLPTLIAGVSALQQSEFFEVPLGEEAKGVDVELVQGVPGNLQVDASIPFHLGKIPHSA